MTNDEVREKMLYLIQEWRKDWNKFIRDAFGVKLDKEQQAILSSVQFNSRTTVSSGTARGKDYVAACAALCFLELTPRWNTRGELIENTKVALTAPTGRQVENIMMPEIARLWNRAKARGIELCGRLNACKIQTNNKEWFLAGFKADENNHEAWSGFHAVNTMFVITEASGIPDTVYNAIEGNLQGNSRLLLVFNPNITTGYAARSMVSPRFEKFRLSSLNAENVIKKKLIIPGQVDYEWVKDKVETWCTRISEDNYDEGRGDFKWEGGLYTPNDLFRVKVLGMFPSVSKDTLIPLDWVLLANKRWEELKEQSFESRKHARIGVDVAGMGRDKSCFVYRFGNYVSKIITHNSGGEADHMAVAGEIFHELSKDEKSKAFIDTIGEGAGVYSRLKELGCNNAFSCKFSSNATGLHDITGCYTFSNMRAYLFWAIRDWLDPKNGFYPAIPPDDELTEELCEPKWFFQSNGSILIEPKENLKVRLKRSPDKMDALANTFYPHCYDSDEDKKAIKMLL